MNLQQITACLEFLKRADLKGAEVPAFVDVNNALQELYQAEVKKQQDAVAKAAKKTTGA